jgi:hypothetical protein
MDTFEFVMRFEGMHFEGDEEGMSSDEIIDGFSELIKSGAIGGLQGFYGRYAAMLIDAGYLAPNGDVLEYDDPEF